MVSRLIALFLFKSQVENLIFFNKNGKIKAREYGMVVQIPYRYDPIKLDYSLWSWYIDWKSWRITPALPELDAIFGYYQDTELVREEPLEYKFLPPRIGVIIDPKHSTIISYNIPEILKAIEKYFSLKHETNQIFIPHIYYGKYLEYRDQLFELDFMRADNPHQLYHKLPFLLFVRKNN